MRHDPAADNTDPTLSAASAPSLNPPAVSPPTAPPQRHVDIVPTVAAPPPGQISPSLAPAGAPVKANTQAMMTKALAGRAPKGKSPPPVVPCKTDPPYKRPPPHIDTANILPKAMPPPRALDISKMSPMAKPPPPHIHVSAGYVTLAASAPSLKAPPSALSFKVHPPHVSAAPKTPAVGPGDNLS